MSTDILAKIEAYKREEIAEAKLNLPYGDLEILARNADAPRGFLNALKTKRENGQYALIAEVKKASPSKGLIREDFDPESHASDYEVGGAACLSVLTDKPSFQGAPEFLKKARAATSLPVLRKDFILDSYQLFEARAAGADAVLLIAECLDDCNLRKLHNEAIDLGMTPLVEFYEPENLQRVIDAGADLIGVNNRDLKTFHTDLNHVVRMREKIPPDRLVVAESGIFTRKDVEQLAVSGIQAMLVGESLMRENDIGQAVRALLGR